MAVRRLTDAAIGERILDLISKSAMIDVQTQDEKGNYRSEPNPVVYVWAANSTEQLGALVRDIHRELSIEPATNDD